MRQFLQDIVFIALVVAVFGLLVGASRRWADRRRLPSGTER